MDSRGLNKLDLATHRIRHSLPASRWPTRAEAERARWFSPIQLGRTVVAAERTWVPAMVPWRATEDGFVTPEVLEWYARFAEGQPGVLVVEATGIRDIASGPLLRIGDDRFVPGLRTLVETVRERSRGRTRLFIQLLDFLPIRRRPAPALAPDETRCLRQPAPASRSPLIVCSSAPSSLSTMPRRSPPT